MKDCDSEQRMRHTFGNRYDHRDNLVDWDYHMKLHEKAPIISKREYARWREMGIAFEVRESNYNCSNRSMATVEGLKDGKVVLCVFLTSSM